MASYVAFCAESRGKRKDPGPNKYFVQGRVTQPRYGGRLAKLSISLSKLPHRFATRRRSSVEKMFVLGKESFHVYGLQALMSKRPMVWSPEDFCSGVSLGSRSLVHAL
jgi:hypothetical protein